MRSLHTSQNKNKISAKEAALTKMLVATSILFIVCLVPILMVQIATFLVKDLNYDGRYHNLTSVLWQCINTFRCLNSSLNFFIYFRMGSKFRETLRELVSLPCCSDKKWHGHDWCPEHESVCATTLTCVYCSKMWCARTLRVDNGWKLGDNLWLPCWRSVYHLNCLLQTVEKRTSWRNR